MNTLPYATRYRGQAASPYPGPCYVGAAVRRATANLSAGVAAVAALLALAACGGGERRDAGATDRAYTVDVERASFAARQHLAQRSALVITVRNAGEDAIPNLTVTVRGFTDQSGGPANADRSRDVWIVDRGPATAATAHEDTWTAGRLEPGARTTLRWELTPVVAGSHAVSYAIAPAVAGEGRVTLAGGGRPRGSLAVQVSGTPAQARVDPRTGEVRRRE